MAPFDPQGYSTYAKPEIYSQRRTDHAHSSRDSARKGRGGYNGNRGNSGRGNYDSRASTGTQSSAAYQPVAPSPWGMQYNNYHNLTVGHMAHHPGSRIPPALANNQATTTLQPHHVSSSYLVPAIGHANTLAHATSIATPAMGNTILSNDAMPPAASTEKNAAHNAPANERSPAVSAEPDIMRSFESRSAVMDTYVPNEGRNHPIDDTRPAANDTVDRLGYETLMHLQIFNITLAAKLQHTLKDAKAAFEAQEAVHVKKRAILLSLLQAARDSELACDVTVRRHYDQFYHYMTEACAKQGDIKSAAQTQATIQLKSATTTSKLALEDRAKIEKYRNELLDIDNARAISRNVYSDTVHDVLIRALGGEAVESGTAINIGDRLTQPDTAGAGTTSENGAGSSEAYVQAKRQGVFEGHPRTENQSIGEVLDTMGATEERAKKVEAPMQQSMKREGKAKAAGKEKGPEGKAKNKMPTMSATSESQGVKEPKDSYTLEIQAPQSLAQGTIRKKSKNKKHKQKNGGDGKTNEDGKGDGEAANATPKAGSAPAEGHKGG
jgi:hypothetical protein